MLLYLFFYNYYMQQENIENTHSLQSGFYYPAIDSLRFFAFLFVFLGHMSLPVIPDMFAKISWYGVELFFLISGFLITKILSSEYSLTSKIKISNYFIRRILRIWPLYFTYLAMVVIYFWISIHALPDGRRLAGNLFFIDNIFSAFYGYNHNKGTSHLWSISLEEQYYLFLPFFTLWLLKQKNAMVHISILVIFILLMLGKLIAIYFQFKHPFIYVLPISGECFFLGFMLGLGVYNSYIIKQNPFILFCSGIVLLIIVYLLPSREIISYNQLFLYLLLALGFGFIFIAVVFGNSRIINLIFNNKVLVYLGKISFGLYIYHWLILEKMTHYFKNTSPFFQLLGILFIFLITVLIAALSYEMFEKRFLRLKKRFTVIKSREV